jgi:hypothetical protein
MTDVWESVWDLLSDEFRQIAAALSASYPEMSWSSGHGDNKSFPFRAYAAFNRGHEDAEDVIASIDFHRSNDELRYSADIGLDDGKVLADRPTGTIDVANGLARARPEVEAAVRDIKRFLEASESVFRGAL